MPAPPGPNGVRAAAALAAALSPSFGMLAIGPDGALYVADWDRIRRIGMDGAITALPMPSPSSGTLRPNGLAFGPDGSMFVADMTGSRTWKKSLDGVWSVVAGTGIAGTDGDDGLATLARVQPVQVAVGPSGAFYFDDFNRYRTVDPQGDIHAFAGTGTAGFSGDTGPAVHAQFATNVMGVAVDQRGNVYLGDQEDHRIRMVDAAGILTTVVGTGAAGQAGDGGQATAASVFEPVSIAVDDDGSFLFVDSGTNVVRKVEPSGVISTIAGGGKAGDVGDCGPATTAALRDIYGLAVHDGAVYLSDEGDHRIRMVVP